MCVCVCVVDAFNRLCEMLFHDKVLQSELNQPNKMHVRVVFEKEFLDGVLTSVSTKIAAYFLLKRRDNFQPCLW